MTKCRLYQLLILHEIKSFTFYWQESNLRHCGHNNDIKLMIQC